MTTEKTHIHPFEKAGLGEAPFRFVYSEVCTYQACPGAPIQPGTCCDYCYTGIKNVFWIQGACGSKFKVGCDCVNKTTKKGERILSDVEREVRRMKREATHKRQDERIANCIRSLTKCEARQKLRAIPHPLKWRAGLGENSLHWAIWMLRNSGRAGSMKVVRVVEKL